MGPLSSPAATTIGTKRFVSQSLAATRASDNLLIEQRFQAIRAASKKADVAAMRRDYAIRFRVV